jgi:hypothetical protein
VEVFMTVTRFEGGGPVARYWLANCEGFVVKGGARGVVEDLLHDADPHVTTRLVIRTRARRRKIISASTITTVVPAESVLIVSPRPGRMYVEAPRVAAAVAAKRVASAVPPTRAALLVARRHAVMFASVIWTVAQPMLLALAQSFRILAVESRATGRMLARSAPTWSKSIQSSLRELSGK